MANLRLNTPNVPSIILFGFYVVKVHPLFPGGTADMIDINRQPIKKI